MNKRAEEFVNSKTSELNGLEPDKLTVIKWLTDFASDEVEAINYTHSCKSDSELLLKKQSDWLMIHTKLEVENIVSFTEEFKQ